MARNKILVILGPTATGKSDLAVKLAKKFDGEVISADSRQVYKGLDIGTGKISKKEMWGVPHHLLSIVPLSRLRSSSTSFDVAQWKKLAEEKIADILSRDKLPIICGGTGFYIRAIVDNLVLPEVPPDWTLRKKLANVGHSQIIEMLKKLDLRRMKMLVKEHADKNPVRLIRAIEIAKELGKVPTFDSTQGKKSYDFLQIGLNLPTNELKKKIHARLVTRMKKGMIQEAKNLHKKGLSWKRMRELGLEYHYLAEFVVKQARQNFYLIGAPAERVKRKNFALLAELKRNIEKGNLNYAKRQMTWFKKDKRIKWFQPKEFSKISNYIRLNLDR